MNGESEVFWANQDHGFFVNIRLGACRMRRGKRLEGEEAEEDREGRGRRRWE